MPRRDEQGPSYVACRMYVSYMSCMGEKSPKSFISPLHFPYLISREKLIDKYNRTSTQWSGGGRYGAVEV